MVLPLCAFRADCVLASHILCRLCTAILAHLAIGTYLDAVFTSAALLAEASTVRAVFAAIGAEVIGTVAAVIAFLTHGIGTVDAYAAIRTKFVYTSGALAAILANVFCTIRANYSAILTDFRTLTAQIAILAEKIVRAFPADITGGTEFVAARRADFSAFGAKIGTIFASLAAGTDDAAVRTESAGYAEAVRSGAVHTFAAFGTQFSVGAAGALFAAFHADHRTVCASAAA